MTLHPAFVAGRVAVITGAASGIGLATAERCAGLGMKICMVDINAKALADAAETVSSGATSPGDVIWSVTDVADRDAMVALKAKVQAFGEIAVLMNNAGTEGGGSLFGDPDRWQRILSVNLQGMINGVQVFGADMLAQSFPSAIINTGSKQGITCPPGDTAYNISKAGVKVLSEALAHEIRQHHGCQTSAFLLIPGFTFTGFTKVHTATKPAAAWTPEQVVDFMLARMSAGDFYILCPDNDVTRALDNKRIRWAAADIIENRPPLSRWHADYKAAFAATLDDA